VPRRSTEIRMDGRNVETFDRLRHWAYAQISEYRCGPRETWNEVVDARALAIAADVRSAHEPAAHPYTDAEALDTAKSVAGWVWSRYVGGHLTRVRADTAARRESDRQRATAARRARGQTPRDVWLEEVQRRRIAAATLRALGVAVDEIARRLSAGVSTVHRWLSELNPLVRSVSGPSAPSDFEPPRRAKCSEASSVASTDAVKDVVNSELETPERASIAAAIDGSGVGPPSGTDGTNEQCANETGRGVRGETNVESPIAYIQRRIAAIVARCRAERPP
jgi:hypothetical protein